MISLILLLLFAGSAFADWSPPITIYDSDPQVSAGPTTVTIGIDEAENVHIVYSFRFVNPHYPTALAVGLLYLKFDEHGHQLVNGVFLNDSMDIAATSPQIRFFGRDSLCVFWYRVHRFLTEFEGMCVRTMDLQGNILGPMREWPELPYGLSNSVDYAVTPDRNVIAVYPDFTGYLRCVVQRPNGTRIMNHTMIWNRIECRIPMLRMDATDSLQMVWSLYDWDRLSIYAKRIDVSHPFDTTQTRYATLLTPEVAGQYWGCSPMLSRMGEDFALQFDGPPLGVEFADGYLRTMRRSNYATIAQLNLGPGGPVIDSYSRWAEFDADSIISSWGHWTLNDQLRFRRHRSPDLQAIEDNTFAYLPPANSYIGDYAISHSGTRHVIFHRNYQSDRTQLIYRYWRSDLGTDEGREQEAPSPFVLWPNPTNGGVNLNGPLEQVKNIAVYNVLGQLVQEFALGRQARATISLPDIGKLSSGTYYLIIRTHHESVVRKLVIQK